MHRSTAKGSHAHPACGSDEAVSGPCGRGSSSARSAPTEHPHQCFQHALLIGWLLPAEAGTQDFGEQECASHLIPVSSPGLAVAPQGWGWLRFVHDLPTDLSVLVFCHCTTATSSEEVTCQFMEIICFLVCPRVTLWVSQFINDPLSLTEAFRLFPAVINDHAAVSILCIWVLTLGMLPPGEMSRCGTSVGKSHALQIPCRGTA